jgi:para-nitrobenzyl esterase
MREILKLMTIASILTLGLDARAQVRVDSGLLAGGAASVPGVRAYLGIPYAEPPLGSLRWREPRPVQPWQGARPATEFGPRAMQGPIYSDMIFRDRGPSEDCLYLNVWTPARSADERLPVMVWIHGGGFQAGSSSEPRQDGGRLAAKGVVVVSLNYRLGLFGFLAHPELTAESGCGASGNYGLMDQIAALAWVRRNIASFGGDPGNVTIFGESAGAYSVSLLMTSPLARGLFHKAIAESGALFRTRDNERENDTPLKEAEQVGVRFAAAVGAKSLADLREMPAAELLGAYLKDTSLEMDAIFDGRVIPADGYAVWREGRQAKVPLLAGWTADEQRAAAVFGSKRPTAQSFASDVRRKYGIRANEVLKLYPAGSDREAVASAGDLASDQFIGYCAWKLVDAQVATGGEPVYRYSFDRAVPVAPGTTMNGAPATGADIGAVHASEISYVFGALADVPGVTWEPGDWKLSETMAGYWTNFARTGNPNGPGLPEWPRCVAEDGFAGLHLDLEIHAAPLANRARYEFWDADAAPRREGR